PAMALSITPRRPTAAKGIARGWTNMRPKPMTKLNRPAAHAKAAVSRIPLRSSTVAPFSHGVFHHCSVLHHCSAFHGVRVRVVVCVQAFAEPSRLQLKE